MNIALPKGLKEFVQEQISSGGYSSVSEYVRARSRITVLAEALMR